MQGEQCAYEEGRRRHAALPALHGLRVLTHINRLCGAGGLGCVRCGSDRKCFWGTRRKELGTAEGMLAWWVNSTSEIPEWGTDVALTISPCRLLPAAHECCHFHFGAFDAVQAS